MKEIVAGFNKRRVPSHKHWSSSRDEGKNWKKDWRDSQYTPLVNIPEADDEVWEDDLPASSGRLSASARPMVDLTDTKFSKALSKLDTSR